MRKVVPLPTSLSTKTKPPDCLTMPNTIERPRPGALADVLRGEEGLEDLLLHLRRNAAAIVLDLDQHVIRRNQRGLVELGAFRAGDVAGAKLHLPPDSGMASRALTTRLMIDLLELVDVGLHEPEVAAVTQIELDLLADEAAQQDLQLRQHVAELQHLRAQRLAAREGEQLPRRARRRDWRSA